MPIVNMNDQAELKQYMDFLAASPNRKLTQTVEWGRVKSNWEPCYVYVTDDAGRLEGAMSILMIANKQADGKKLAYCSKGPVCDVHDVALVKRLYDEASDYLQQQDVFVLRADPEVEYTEKYDHALREAGFTVRNKNVVGHGTIMPRYNMLLNISGYTLDNIDELLMSFHSKTRYNIRLAKRKGVTVDYANSSRALDLFYHTHEIMAKRQHITYRPKEYFERVLDMFGNHVRVYLAHDDEEVLSGAIAMNYGDRVWYMYGGSTNNKRNLMPNYLMQWEMIKWAIETNKEIYDFGGIFEVDLDDGLYRFKNGFTNGVTEYIGEIDRVFDEKAYRKYNEHMENL
ncbi:lipid II:glycine glycyltransferase FemX [Ligilactobacillus sp. LYQ60]|uniref:lipid II:glycine glycyltransferase FemX n=1 Tax=unclassified Ligilactobacillus TaxID=2767920 RepID=UPI0038535F2E